MKTNLLIAAAVVVGGTTFSSAASAQALQNCNVVKDQNGNVAIFADRDSEDLTTIQRITFLIGGYFIFKVTDVVLEVADDPSRVYAPIKINAASVFVTAVRLSNSVRVVVDGVVQACNFSQHQIVGQDVAGHVAAYPTGDYDYPTCPDCVIHALCTTLPVMYGTTPDAYCPNVAQAYDDQVIHDAMYEP